MINITKTEDNSVILYRLDNDTVTNPYYVLSFEDKVITQDKVISIQNTSNNSSYIELDLPRIFSDSLSGGQGTLYVYESADVVESVEGLTLLKQEEYEVFGYIDSPISPEIVSYKSPVEYVSYKG